MIAADTLVSVHACMSVSEAMLRVHYLSIYLPVLHKICLCSTPSSGLVLLFRGSIGTYFPRTGQVFADQRYQRHDKRDKLPGWITSHLRDAHLNLSTDMLLHVAREFMRSMAQPYDRLAIGKSLLTEEQANALGAPAAPMLA